MTKDESPRRGGIDGPHYWMKYLPLAALAAAVAVAWGATQQRIEVAEKNIDDAKTQIKENAEQIRRLAITQAVNAQQVEQVTRALDKAIRQLEESRSDRPRP